MDPYNGGNYNQQYIEALLFNSEAQPHQVNHQAQVHPVNHQAQVHHQEYQPQPQPQPVKHQVNQAYPHPLNHQVNQAYPHQVNQAYPHQVNQAYENAAFRWDHYSLENLEKIIRRHYAVENPSPLLETSFQHQGEAAATQRGKKKGVKTGSKRGKYKKKGKKESNSNNYCQSCSAHLLP